jgi:hypothetical protein
VEGLRKGDLILMAKNKGGSSKKKLNKEEKEKEREREGEGEGARRPSNSQPQVPANNFPTSAAHCP